MHVCTRCDWSKITRCTYFHGQKQKVEGMEDDHSGGTTHSFKWLSSLGQSDSSSVIQDSFDHIWEHFSFIAITLSHVMSGRHWSLRTEDITRITNARNLGTIALLLSWKNELIKAQISAKKNSSHWQNLKSSLRFVTSWWWMIVSTLDIPPGNSSWWYNPAEGILTVVALKRAQCPAPRWRTRGIWHRLFRRGEGGRKKERGQDSWEQWRACSNSGGELLSMFKELSWSWPWHFRGSSNPCGELLTLQGHSVCSLQKSPLRHGSTVNSTLQTHFLSMQSSCIWRHGLSLSLT